MTSDQQILAQGIMGFSQGGTFATLVSGLASQYTNVAKSFCLSIIRLQLESPNHTPHFRGINHPPLYVQTRYQTAFFPDSLCHSEFLVLFSCFKILNPGFSAPKNMKTPTLLVVGSNDTVVLPEHSYDLAGFFDKANVRIEVHNGGKNHK